MVLDAQYLMHHSLIRPLVEQRGYWVVPPIKDQQDRGDVGVEGKEVVFTSDDLLWKGGGGYKGER